MKRKVLSVLLAACMVFAMTACGSKNEKAEAKKDEGKSTEKESLQEINVAYNPSTGSILSFIAMDEGFAEEEGLKFNMQTFDNSTDALTALQAGKSDIGVNFGTAAPLSFIANGADLTMFGGYVQGGMPVYASSDFEYTDLSSFVGKTIAVPRMYTPDLIWRQAMIEAGYDLEKDVTIIEFKKPSEVLAAVQAGKADVGVGTNSTYMKAVAGGLKVLTWTNDLEPDAVCCRQVANSEWFKDNQDLAEAYTRTLIKAEAYLNENPDESVDIFKKYMEMEEADARTLLLETNQNFESDPNSNGIKAMWNTMCDIGYVENTDVDVDKYIDIKTYKSALDSVIKEDPENEYYKNLETQYEKFNSELLAK